MNKFGANAGRQGHKRGEKSQRSGAPNKGVAAAKRAQKRKEARERQKASDKLSPKERLALLDSRLGEGQGATKERKKLQERIDNPNAFAGKVKNKKNKKNYQDKRGKGHRARQKKRKKVLDEMARVSQEIGGYKEIA